MQRKSLFLDYLCFYGGKLGGIFLFITVLHVGVIILIWLLCPAIPLAIPVFWISLPLFGVIAYWILNPCMGGKKSLAYCKYNRWLPFWFRYRPNPKMGKRVDLNSIKSEIKTGDVVLRKYRFYIDEFIFSANSYFTHVGIYDGKGQVLHCTSLHNVHETPLDKFCNGDDIAVLRFSYNKSPEEENVYGDIANPEYETDDKKKADEKLRNREEEIFTRLMQNAKPGCLPGVKEDYDAKPAPHPEIQVVVDRARSLIGRLYDLKFDFRNFKRFSCIEYVWYCYKCFFPLHRIRVKDFEFFKIHILPIIDPDVFIRNDFFYLIYSSVKKANTKALLIDKIKQRRYTITLFLLAVLAWDAIPMILFCYYYCH